MQQCGSWLSETQSHRAYYLMLMRTYRTRVPHSGPKAKKGPRRGFRLVMLPMQSSKPMSRVRTCHVKSLCL